MKYDLKTKLEVLLFGVLYTSPLWITGLLILAVIVGAVGGLVYLIRG